MVIFTIYLGKFTECNHTQKFCWQSKLLLFFLELLWLNSIFDVYLHLGSIGSFFFLPLLNNSLIFHRAGSFKKFLAPFRAKMVSFWASKFHFCLILCFFPVRQTLICDDEEELDETPQSISISPFFCGPLTPNLFLRLFYTSNKTLNRITQILWLPN